MYNKSLLYYSFNNNLNSKINHKYNKITNSKKLIHVNQKRTNKGRNTKTIGKGNPRAFRRTSCFAIKANYTPQKTNA